MTYICTKDTQCSTCTKAATSVRPTRKLGCSPHYTRHTHTFSHTHTFTHTYSHTHTQTTHIKSGPAVILNALNEWPCCKMLWFLTRVHSARKYGSLYVKLLLTRSARWMQTTYVLGKSDSLHCQKESTTLWKGFWCSKLENI